MCYLIVLLTFLLYLCYYMWFKKSLCPIEKMPVATKLLIGPVWDMIIISVVSSK